MVKRQPFFRFLFLAIFIFSGLAVAEQAGSIRGIIYDKDFDAPLSGAQVLIAETEQKAETAEQGNFLLNEIKPGNYTLVISKEGYTRQVKGNVIVTGGQMTEIEAQLTGEFTEMEEFVVQDVQIGTGTEAALLDLRMESPALMDSVSSELMSQAGASDAASALKLVSGATVQDGKYATVRGLPDRYVNSQMNGVRLPTADSDKRAVQLDQFPSSVIESIQVSKTFTPDQQGDASGGAVNVILKGIPQENFIKFESGMSSNSQMDTDKFQSYKGGGVNYWGSRNTRPQTLGKSWQGGVGATHAVPHTDYKWSISGGGRYDLNDDWTIGAFGSFYYDQDASFSEDGIDDKYGVRYKDLQNGSSPYPMYPQYSGGNPEESDPDDFSRWKTSLYDKTVSTQSVQWGGLGVIGLENENNKLKYLYMYNKDATDKVTVTENTRGRESLHKYWPDYYPEVTYDENMPSGYNKNASYVIRNQTLEYTERTTETAQLSGWHKLDFIGFGIDNLIEFYNPEIDWTISKSSSRLYQPDKRMFSEYWKALYNSKGVYKGGKFYAEYFTGDEGSGQANLYRIWKDIKEESDQYSINIKVPFEQWSGDEGYLKFGIFDDKVTRNYDQDTYGNFGDTNDSYKAEFDDSMANHYDEESHPIYESIYDVDYKGKQNISAWYFMADVPVTSYLSFIGGVRYEKTELSIENFPDKDPYGNITAKIYYWDWDDSGNVNISLSEFDSDASDVEYVQNDILPSIGFEFQPWESLTVRGSYTETIARQTFKELSPIRQMEYIGADVFAGNPDLTMSSLKNYDLRLDYTPYRGGLISASYFYKDIKNPIEYIQLYDGIETFITAVNYPKGEISGFEFELRQEMGRFWDDLNGLMIGANATFIESKVYVSEDELKSFKNYNAPADPTRDMMNAPEHLYNIYTTYDIEDTGTRLGMFYTVRGDTLVAGAAANGEYYIPPVYEVEYGTLNASVTQKLGEDWKVKFQAKNILNPKIQTVYRSKYISNDCVKTSYRKGVDLSLSLGAKF